MTEAERENKAWSDLVARVCDQWALAIRQRREREAADDGK
jgi:hypothetical protein